MAYSETENAILRISRQGLRAPSDYVLIPESRILWRPSRRLRSALSAADVSASGAVFFVWCTRPITKPERERWETDRSEAKLMETKLQFFLHCFQAFNRCRCFSHLSGLAPRTNVGNSPTAESPSRANSYSLFCVHHCTDAKTMLRHFRVKLNGTFAFSSGRRRNTLALFMTRTALACRS